MYLSSTANIVVKTKKPLSQVSKASLFHASARSLGRVATAITTWRWNVVNKLGDSSGKRLPSLFNSKQLRDKHGY